MLENPATQHVAEQEDAIRYARLVCVIHAAPWTLGGEETLASLPDGLEDESHDCIGIFHDHAAESYVDWGWTSVKKGLEVRGSGVVRGPIEDGEPHEGYVRPLVLWFGHQGWRPAVGVWDFETLEHAWRPDHTHMVQTMTLCSKLVDDVTNSLPGEEFDQSIAHVIGELRVGVGGLDVGQRMGEGLGGRRRRGGHDVQGDAQFLSAIDMGQAGRGLAMMQSATKCLTAGCDSEPASFS